MSKLGKAVVGVLTIAQLHLGWQSEQSDKNQRQSGAELGQAQLPTGSWLYWD